MTSYDVYRTLVANELARHRAIIHIDLGTQQQTSFLMDTVREAREKCPELVLVHVATFTGSNPPAYHKSPSATTHKVSLDEYRRASRRIMDLFKQQCSTMSKASVDEAYFDASEMLRQKIADDFEQGILELSSGRDAVEMDQMLLSPIPYDSDIDMALPVPV
ncbi:N-acetyltransferase eso1, partial [Coemansia sp. RSA 521]